MWPFKNKYDKLTRNEIIDSICKLEKELDDIERNLASSQKDIDTMMEKGRNETSREMKLFLAKKINFLKSNREADVKRAMYIMYNIQLLNKLKVAVDDNQFFKKTKGMSLGNLLKDQKGLAKFLNKTLNTKVDAENVLTEADETFKVVMDAYEENNTIYGKQDADDALLAMFETAASAEDTKLADNTNKAQTGDTK